MPGTGTEKTFKCWTLFIFSFTLNKKGDLHTKSQEEIFLRNLAGMLTNEMTSTSSGKKKRDYE